MKAVVYERYGPPEVLQLKEVEKPAPKDDEVLIKIHATTVTVGDCELRSMKSPLWLALPMRLFGEVRRPGRIRIIWQEISDEVAVAGA